MTQGRREIVQAISNPILAGEQDVLFFVFFLFFFVCPQSHFCGAFWLRVWQFCAHIFLFLSRNNSIPWIHFLFFLPCCHFLLPGLGNRAFSSHNQRGKSYARWRLTGIYSFFLFSCEGNEMKNGSAMVYQPLILTQWPATYPKQLQVSPLSDHYFSILCT